MTTAQTPREFCAYLRVSDEAGREGASFHSPEVQRDRIKVVVEGLHNSTVVTEFEDMSFTGRVMERPGLIAAVDWVMEDPTKRGIATLNVSRLARNTKGIIELVQDRLVPAGAAFVSAEQMIDTTTAYGRKQLRDLASDAEAQSDMIGETWSRVLAKRARRGDHPTGKEVFGYRKVPDPEDPSGKTSILVPDEEGGTAETVRRIYRYYNAGTGYREIVRILNEDGVLSPKGLAWGITTLRRLMDSPSYVGMIEYKGELLTDESGKPVRARWTPLISEAAWEMYKAERARRGKTRTRSQVPKWALGGGLSTCGKCGARLICSNLSAPKGQVICSSHRNKGTCEGVSMVRYRFDGQFAIMLGNWLKEVGAAASESHDAEVQRIREEASAIIGKAEARLDVIMAARKNLRRQAAEGLMTDDELRADLADYKAEEDLVRAEVIEARERMDAANPLGETYVSLLETFEVEDQDGQVVPFTDQDFSNRVSGKAEVTAATWSRTLQRVIRRVELHDDRIVFVPVIGENDPTQWRTVMRTRKPRRRPVRPTDRREWEQPIEPVA